MPKPGKTKPKQNSAKAEKAPVSPYRVFLSTAAKQAYTAYFERAEKAKQRGDLTNEHIKKLRLIDEVIEVFIPRDPFNIKYALTGELSKVFRIHKGRLRICWIGSSEKKLIYIVFIAETLRKAGDVNDPYRLLTNMMLSGEFEGLFAELGLAAPLRAKYISGPPVTPP
jgi:mRNA-degrading endonuclease RelE of RelBE toxin-antitoxin system